MIFRRKVWFKEPFFFPFFSTVLGETFFYIILKNKIQSQALLQSQTLVQYKYYRNTLSVLYNLEGDWRDVVENSQMLSEKQSQQQTALWELAETEVAYIKTLKVVTDVSKVSTYFLHFKPGLSD